jgi:hypothetical protein
MRRPSFLSLALLAGITTGVRAQQPPSAPATTPMSAPMSMKMSDIAGTWDAKTMMGPKDSVVVTEVLTMTADGKAWTMAFPGRADAVPVKVVSMGGDSVVTDAGPYASALRAGQMVTVHMVAHYKGDSMWGTALATYSSGDKATLKMAATRRK